MCVCVTTFCDRAPCYTTTTQTQTSCQGLLRNRWCNSAHKRQRNRGRGNSEEERQEKKDPGKSIKILLMLDRGKAIPSWCCDLKKKNTHDLTLVFSLIHDTDFSAVLVLHVQWKSNFTLHALSMH